MGQRRILQIHHIDLLEVGESPVDHDALAFGLGGVEPNAEEIEGEIDRDALQQLGIGGRCARQLRHAVAQFGGAEQIGVAPGRRLALVAELLQRVGAEFARVLVGGIGEHQLARRRWRPSDIARPQNPRGRASARRPRRPYTRSAFARILGARQRIEIGGIGVVPAEIELIDRLGIVAQRAVIAACRPVAGEALPAASAARRSRSRSGHG